MQYAVLARTPVFGGKVASFDATKAKAVPGVKQVVQISNGDRRGSGRHMVCHGRPQGSGNQVGRRRLRDAEFGQASARCLSNWRRLPARWRARKVMQRRARWRGQEDGSRVRSSLSCPCPHGACELHCSRKRRTVSSCGSARRFKPRRSRCPAQKAGVTPEKVSIETMMLGGGFGRRGSADFVGEAVEISKAVGTPSEAHLDPRRRYRSRYFPSRIAHPICRGTRQRRLARRA